MDYRTLVYFGLTFPHCRITSQGELELRLKSGLWRKKNWYPSEDGYRYTTVPHPVTWKQKRVMRHVAVSETFRGRPFPNAVVAHRPGSSRSDCALELTRFTSPADNRADRLLAGTHSTGIRTGRRLSPAQKTRIRIWLTARKSVRSIANAAGCSRQAVMKYRICS